MSGGSSRIRILAVDDHPLVRQGIAGLVDVQPDMTVVAEAANGRDAITQFRTHRRDVTLMDIQMPEMNGLDARSALVVGLISQVPSRTRHRNLQSPRTDVRGQRVARSVTRS
jgi:DNA-binding NarL/FixJ family response regulator